MEFIKQTLQSIRANLVWSDQNKFHITSFPKAGRTWLKVMLYEYLIKKYNLHHEKDLLIENFHKHNFNIPYIRFIHDDTPFWKKPSELKHSKKSFQSSKVILMIRDPRDMIVSGYFQKSKRHKLQPKEVRDKNNKPVYTKSLERYVYEEVGGIESLIEYYNIWWEQKKIPRDFKLIKYENLTKDTFSEVHSILDFLGIRNVDIQLLNKVIKITSFDNLKQLEKNREYNSTKIMPLDENDPESYKVRRGKVGGYVDYLKQPEIDYLNEQISQKLNPLYGYS